MSIDNLSSEFTKKFMLEKLLLNKVGSWIISLRPQQPTIGSMVLTLDRHCEKLSQISNKEGEELSQAFRFTEEILEKSFQPDKINYLALMMIDNQVHFHIIPRYEHKKEFANRAYIDKGWPGPPLLESEELNQDSLLKLHLFMKSHLF